MQTYSAPLRDMRFVLNELLDMETLSALPGFEDATPDVIDAMIEEGAKLCENTLLPLNRPADEEGCHYENGVVRTPAGYKEAYRTLVDAGWTGVTVAPDYGGKGLPQLISMVFDEMVCSTNLAFGVYPLLSNGAAALIESHGTEELKQTYLPPLADGTWSGTMCLTESHCGTDLGLIRTKAVPQGEGPLRALRHQDLHLRRRARPDPEHRPPGAGEAARLTRRRARHQPLPRAQAHAQRRRHAGGRQRRYLRLDRGEDGHSRVGDLRDALRGGGGLPDRPGAQGAALHGSR